MSDLKHILDSFKTAQSSEPPLEQPPGQQFGSHAAGHSARGIVMPFPGPMSFPLGFEERAMLAARERQPASRGAIQSELGACFAGSLHQNSEALSPSQGTAILSKMPFNQILPAGSLAQHGLPITDTLSRILQHPLAGRIPGYGIATPAFPNLVPAGGLYNISAMQSPSNVAASLQSNLGLGPLQVQMPTSHQPDVRAAASALNPAVASGTLPLATPNMALFMSQLQSTSQGLNFGETPSGVSDLSILIQAATAALGLPPAHCGISVPGPATGVLPLKQDLAKEQVKKLVCEFCADTFTSLVSLDQHQGVCQGNSGGSHSISSTAHPQSMQCK